MDEKETMTLVRTLTMRIIELESDLKTNKEMRDFYFKKNSQLEIEIQELKDKYIHNKAENEEENIK